MSQTKFKFNLTFDIQGRGSYCVRHMGELGSEVIGNVTLTDRQLTTTRRGSAETVLSWCRGHVRFSTVIY